MSLREQQFFVPYTSPHFEAYPDRAKEKAPGGTVLAVLWTTDRESYIGVAKNVIAVEDLPKNFDDLLRPALKEKMALSNDESSALNPQTLDSFLMRRPNSLHPI
jgi:ABC-type Fe3+ transport system substrate-binding protein